jgi:hypothetical protein
MQASGQPGQAAAAGHDDRTTTGARQQRADLLLVRCVVQQQQDPSTGEGGAEPAGRCGEVCRWVVGGVAQGLQHPGQCVQRLEVRSGAEAAQIEVQVPVGEVIRDLVGGVHGHGRLADPAHAGDGGDADTRGLGQAGGELVQLLAAPGEVAGGERQLTRCGWPGPAWPLSFGRGFAPARSGGLERGALVVVQVQCLGECLHCAEPGVAAGAALQGTDRLDADPGAQGELFLGEVGSQPVPPQQCREL